MADIAVPVKIYLREPGGQDQTKPQAGWCLLGTNVYVMTRPDDSMTRDDPETPSDVEAPGDLATPSDVEAPEDPNTPSDADAPEDPDTPSDADAPDNPDASNDVEAPDDPEAPCTADFLPTRNNGRGRLVEV